MLVFAARRLLQAVPILFGVSLIVFGLVQLLPGNPVDMMLPAEAPAEVIARVKAEFGFNDPLPVRYLKWLMQVLHGNLGTSVYTAEPIAPDLLNALGNTLPLAVMATAIGCGGGAVLGLPGRVRARALVRQAVPVVRDGAGKRSPLLVRDGPGDRVLRGPELAAGKGEGGPLWGGEQSCGT